jgi:hypothetical protein
MKVFTIFDSKVGAYLNPFFMRSKGEAIRALTISVNNSDHDFAKFPEDYTLFELGDYEEETAKFNLYPTPTSIGKAIEFVKEQA